MSIDGVQVLSGRTPTLGATALAGFSAGTGGYNDVHAVRDVQITAGAPLDQVAAPAAATWW